MIRFLVTNPHVRVAMGGPSHHLEIISFKTSVGFITPRKCLQSTIFDRFRISFTRLQTKMFQGSSRLIHVVAESVQNYVFTFTMFKLSFTNFESLAPKQQASIFILVTVMSLNGVILDIAASSYTQVS
ncbi:hypothetical protein NPIL_95711 [Nephila pilipes]|uniref:Uncharacterized protein n=1 Tax=Nephila pilipes TaxID=299642 RepID=A0A8X6UC69_NEPPI|nr:hypothetical protein NPIL_95711 [Nephila pilipes]